jgi:hypothetical protein
VFLGANDPNNVVDFAQYGVLGLIVLGFITRKIVAGELLERAEARVVEKDAVIERIRLSMEEKMERLVPALVRSTEVLTEAVDLMARFTEQPAAPRRKPPAER